MRAELTDIEKLKAEMPGIADTLGDRMVSDALSSMQQSCMMLADGMPSVSGVFEGLVEGRKLKITMSIEDADKEDDEP